MSSRPARWLAGIAAAGLLAAGLSAVAPVPARASGGVQTGPSEVGNLLDYANTDFEGTLGNWVSNSNATLTDDPNHQFLHNDSLLDTATTAGVSSFKISGTPNAIDITVKPGATYRVGAYFKVPAADGQTVQFTLSCYDQNGNYIGVVNGKANALLNTTKWQYSEDDIKVPPITGNTSSCATVQGSPKVTLNGLAAGAAVNMDEVIFAPDRSALIIGAHGETGLDGKSSYTGQDWIDTNNIIGPLQSDKEFYGNSSPTLPSQWTATSNNCYSIEQSIGSTQADEAEWPACVINLADFETEAQIQAFFTGLPAAQMAVLIYKDEPEGDTFSNCPATPAPVGNAANYVCYFDLESGYIRQAAAAVGDVPNVFVAMDSSTYQYGNGADDSAGTGCGWIPTTSYTDFYLADHYDPGADGQSLPNENSTTPGDPSTTNGQKWSNWLSCVQSINKPLGLAEYGLDCTTNPDQSVVTQEMSADNTYLGAIPGATEPTIMWAYWFSDAGSSTPGCVFNNTNGAITQWQDDETQNGGG